MSWKVLVGISVAVLAIAIYATSSFSQQGKSIGSTAHPVGKAIESAAFRPSAMPKQAIQLIEAGEGFHGDQMPARNGERWLGLYADGATSALIFSKLKVLQVEDAVIDLETPGKKTAKSVYVERRKAPVFLIRYADVLKPGKVQTIFNEKRESPEALQEHQPLTLQLGKLSYRLMVKNTSYNCNNKTLSPEPSLVLQQGETQQVVFQLKDGCEYMGWHLRWAGDLDGDGKLDFFADMSPQENISSRKLFLSSQAGSGQLVKEVAEFVTTGC